MAQTIAIGKQDPSVYATGSGISGLGTGIGKTLDAAKNVSKCTGTFGNVDGLGFVLANDGGLGGPAAAQTLKNAQDYVYSSPLNSGTFNIYDTGNSGALTSGKYMRIVHNATNILSGLGITKITATNLQGKFESPTKLECLIDPYIGKFCLPRPAFRSFMESIQDLTAPDLSHGNYIPTYTITNYSNLVITPGKFSNCISIEGQYLKDGVFNYYPIGNPGPTLTQGTLSTWINLSISGRATAITKIYISNTTWVEIQHDDITSYSKLFINSVLIDTVGGVTNGFHHYYIVWDSTGNLSNSKCIKVFKDATQILTSADNATFTAGRTSVYLFSTIKDISSTAKAQIDVTKIWSHNVNDATSGGADWEYNSNNGNPNGDHIIYGGTYNPGLLQVGYYKILEDTVPVSLAKPGSNTSVTNDATTYVYGQSVFGSQGIMKKSTFFDVAESTDFNYGDQLDAVGPHIIYDNGTNSGAALAAGTIMRIFHNADNITHTLAIKVYATNLSNTNVSPLHNQCFVDPLRSIYILPRPAYFSRCESYDNLTMPEIRNELPINDIPNNTNLSIVSAKFNNGIRLNFNITNYLFPFGNNVTLDEGTVSTWVNIQTGVFSNSWFAIHYGGDNAYVRIHSSQVIVYIGGIIKSNVLSTIVSTGLHHVYVAWSKSGSLTGTYAYLTVWIDGAEVAGLTNAQVQAAWTSDYFKIHPYVGYNFGDGQLIFDNIKIWKESILSANVDWEYNSGNGRELAMHEIYGASNYVPSTLGIGYFKAGGTGTYLKYSAQSR